MKQKNIQKILELPILKVIFAFIFPTLTGILSSAYINEITLNNKILWKNSFSSFTFLVLLVIVVFMSAYNIYNYRHESNILKYRNKEYCIAYILSQCLPQMAETYNRKIRSGEIPSMDAMMNDIKRALS